MKENKLSFVEGKEINTNIRLPLFFSRDCSDIKCIGQHPLLGIIFLKTGSLAIVKDEKIVIVSSPSLIFFNNKNSCKIKHFEKVELDIIMFHPKVINSKLNIENIFDPKNSIFDLTDKRDIFLLSSFVSPKEQNKFIYNLNVIESIRVESLINQIFIEVEEQSDGYWPCRSRSFLLELLLFSTNLARGYGEPYEKYSSNLNEDILKIIMYIKSNLSNPIKVEDLVKRFHINRTSLNDLFNSYIGENVKSYIIKQKLKLACAVLKETHIPIQEVASRIGYSDFTNFGRIFKKHIGETPKEYRKKNNFHNYKEYRKI